MRIERNLVLLKAATKHQFFLESWLNLVHASSLDAHRVRCMNSRNIVREFCALLEKDLPKIEVDQKRVAQEVIVILEADPTLSNAHFADAKNEFLTQIRLIVSEKSIPDSTKALAKYFGGDLLRSLDAHYLPNLVEFIWHNLQNNAATPTDDELERLHVATGLLMSALIDDEYSLEALFALHKRVLSVAEWGRPYVFAERFTLARTYLASQNINFSVTFTVDGITKLSQLPQSIDGIELSNAAPTIAASNTPAGKSITKFLTRGLGRVFVTMEATAKDHRTAGVVAFRRLNELVDLIRFELEQSQLAVSSEFLVVEGNPQTRARIYKLPNTVPNPRKNIDVGAFSAFMSSLSSVLSNKALSEEGQDRIRSAFRLYRSGLDSETYENKLVNWWTALEYLVRGDASQGGIGNAVEANLAPVLCLGYFSKHLESYRGVLAYYGPSIQNPATGAMIDFKTLTCDELLVLFRDQTILSAITNEFASFPFFVQRLRTFATTFATPAACKAALDKHDQRVRWHIQRLWRTRCDIVHSAHRTLSSTLLCSNLEFYLKALLEDLLRALRKSPSISTPLEYFDRRKYSFQCLLQDLSTGKTAILEKTVREMCD